MTNHTIETVGCDLGDRVSVLYVLRGDGTGQRQRVKTDAAAMREFFTRPRAHVVRPVA